MCVSIKKRTQTLRTSMIARWFNEAFGFLAHQERLQHNNLVLFLREKLEKKASRINLYLPFTVPWHHFMPPSVIPKNCWGSKAFSFFAYFWSLTVLSLRNDSYLYPQKHNYALFSIARCSRIYYLHSPTLLNGWKKKFFSFFLHSKYFSP